MRAGHAVMGAQMIKVFGAQQFLFRRSQRFGERDRFTAGRSQISTEKGYRHTNPKGKMAATVALAVVELLEGVLVNLDFHDLLAARAVSQQWRSVTSQSLALRKILFLASISDVLGEIDMVVSSIHETYAIALTPQPYSVHPLSLPTSFLHIQGSGNTNSAMGSVIRMPILGSAPGSHIYVFKWLVEAMRRVPESESCKSMYLTQPPCTAVEIYIRPPPTPPAPTPTVNYATTRVQNGIKLGMVVATAEDMLRHLEVRQGMELLIRFQG
ncbi:hypothetical protein LTR15_002323 [Elasticomyces elasticus]|nr:hypothetical protein LTR15_002323 [Elasticomyces elasticus]